MHVTNHTYDTKSFIIIKYKHYANMKHTHIHTHTHTHTDIYTDTGTKKNTDLMTEVVLLYGTHTNIHTHTHIW